MNSQQYDTYMHEDRRGYDPKTETYHEQHDWESDAHLANTIVTAVTTVTGDEPTDLDPLYEVVDPNALAAFLGSADDSDDLRWATVELEFNGRVVTVDSHGEICVQCESEDDPPRVPDANRTADRAQF